MRTRSLPPPLRDETLTTLGPPHRGWGWFGQWRIDQWASSDPAGPAGLVTRFGLVQVEFDVSWLAAWYVRRTPALPLIRGYYVARLFWWRHVVAGLLWRRLHWIEKPSGVYFAWRQHFRPLRWGLRLMGRATRR